MESPRMGPYLPYKPAPPSRKTSHPRTTRSSLFPLIIIHVRRYGESSRGPYHPWGAPARVCVSAPAWADEAHRAVQIGRRQGGQPDTPSRTGRARASPDLTSHARLPCPTLPTQPRFSPCPPTLHTYPACPASFPVMPAGVILSTQASHAHPSKRPFVKPFYYFPIYQNVTH